MRILRHRIFLSFLAGKLKTFEQGLPKKTDFEQKFNLQSQ